MTPATALVDLLTRVGLEHRLDHRPAQLSGGERQRVSIARALINRPGLLLCDEPTGNLDVETAASVAELISDLHVQEQNILIVVTHSLELASRFARRFELRDGRVQGRLKMTPPQPASRGGSGRKGQASRHAPRPDPLLEDQPRGARRRGRQHGVLAGALIVGDSVRGSLRDMTLDRLGDVDLALVAERFFPEGPRRPIGRGGRLRERVHAAPRPPSFCPAARCAADTGARASQVSVSWHRPALHVEMFPPRTANGGGGE